MDRGLIFNIQKYCVHDGPGIRTTVFLKGCPLRCSWCHNPESQGSVREIRVRASRCMRCGACVKACPRMDEKEEMDSVPLVPDSCLRCGACLSVCPTEARRMMGREMSVDEVVAAAWQDRMFYDQSGGGVTISGGEPLAQAPFLLQLLRALRDRSIHTALDTSGFAPWEVVRDAASLVDLFLYDLKSIDDRVHRRETGVSNALILSNLDALGRIHENIWIRIPLVPGFNMDDRQLNESVQYLASNSGVRQVNLLPYHRLGGDKADAPGTDGSDAMPPSSSAYGSVTREQLEHVADLFRAAGLCTLIGG